MLEYTLLIGDALDSFLRKPISSLRQEHLPVIPIGSLLVAVDRNQKRASGVPLPEILRALSGKTGPELRVLELDSRVLCDALFEPDRSFVDCQLWSDVGHSQGPPHHSVDRLCLRAFDRLEDEAMSEKYYMEGE